MDDCKIRLKSVTYTVYYTMDDLETFNLKLSRIREMESLVEPCQEVRLL